jgi:hypothetical protein
VGRALDRIFEIGTSKVLSAHVHHDTTSHAVYGDHDLYGEKSLMISPL